MADDPHNTSDISDPIEAGSPREDSETKTARRELKQTTISEKQPQPAGSQQSQEDKSGSDEDTAKDKASQRKSTPEPAVRLAAPHDDLREQVSSPKKKRAHEELDEHKDSDGAAADGEVESKAANGSAALSRTDRSEPEKKRARDHEGDKAPKDGAEDETAASAPDSEAKLTAAETSKETAEETKTEEDKAQTPSTAFAQSGFAKHAASSQSPFGALGSSSKPSLFGASSGGTPSPFGSAASSKAAGAPKLDFSSSSGTSPFGAVGASKPSEPAAAPKLNFTSASSSSPFATVALNGKPSGFASGSTLGGTGSFAGGKTFGSGFGAGSAFGAPRLTSFASQLGETLKSEKPAKPFGAPESDAEESGDDDEEEEEGENGAAGAADEHGEEKDKEEGKQVVDDKKKIRLQKVEVDDGESGDVTILAVRAKMFQMEKGEGWKERGAGMLKVNVPKETVDINEQGYADMASFDASVLEENDTSRVRLILRQDHTLRVILNSPIVPAMKFQLNQKLKAAFVLFTAFESNEVKQVQMKMSETNATNFTQLMDLLQRQLADV
ncbi:hypothetical protein GQ53DRAFT_196230 [Thozetella sp. PMI_491]|nr:hypothetical protein GQ53DRAFT_196230 [Thozetella sp. PMI_491]